MKRLILLSIILFTVGCSNKFTTSQQQENVESLNKNYNIYIAVPVNGSYGTTVYEQSGQMTANAIKSAFYRYVDGVKVINECSTLECLKQTITDHNSYYVVSRIIQWEDRATQWSGKPDVIEIKIAVYDSLNTESISSIIFSGRSKWATLGGDHPQDLLPQPINEYISKLYSNK